MRNIARILSAATFVTLTALLTGCGGSNLSRVTGQVVENGTPVQLASGQSVEIDFETADDANPPLALCALVKPDGSFALDMNDGKGRGLPPRKYKVHLSRVGTTIDRTVNPRLFKEPLVLDVPKDVSLHLSVDLAKGTIAQ